MRYFGGLSVLIASLAIASCGGGDDGGGKSSTGGSASGGKGGTSGTGASGGKGGTPSGGSGGTGAVGGAGGGGGGTVCDASTRTCTPPAPLNWTGPVAYYVGSGTAPACPGEFTTKEAVQHASLDESGASCDCKCDDPTGVVCGQASYATLPNCQTLATNPTKISPGCYAGSHPAGIYQLNVPTPTGGSCAPKTNNVLPTATWKEDAHRCVGPVAETGTDCPTGTDCFPTVPLPYKTCVWAAGDKACPTAFYSEKFLAYDAFVDGRSCAECKCDTPAYSTKCGSIDLTSDCGIFALLIGNGPGCVTTTQSAGAISYSLDPKGTCAPLGGQLTGAVSKSGEVTYCCEK